VLTEYDVPLRAGTTRFDAILGGDGHCATER
jgi:hypothetical protein